MSPDFPTRRAVQEFPGGGTESYLLRLDADNKQIIFSTFWGGSKRETGIALALGPGEAVTVAGESYSDNLPLQNAFRKTFGPTTDAFVTRVCDPWPSSFPSNRVDFGYVMGQTDPLGAQTLDIVTGCQVPHDITEIGADQPWVKLRYEGSTAPLKLTVEVDPSGLEAGEYKGEVKIVVPAAFNKELKIPVSLTVVAP
jgi:hypothetical protein